MPFKRGRRARVAPAPLTRSVKRELDDESRASGKSARGVAEGRRTPDKELLRPEVEGPDGRSCPSTCIAKEGLSANRAPQLGSHHCLVTSIRGILRYGNEEKRERESNT